jgi:hypothetical protein
MRKFLTLLGLTLSLGLAQAASPATPATPAKAASAASPATPATPAVPAAKSTQQNKMKTCNKEAADKKLKGDERKAFMKSCLSNKG